MPPEPERPVEKLLRASAKRRREQVGNDWEMHPATRQMLQGEVARRFGRKREGKPGWFGWFLGQGWVRPMGALAALGAVAVAVAVWISVQAFQSSKNPAALLAKNEQDRRTAAEPSAPAPPATDSASGRTERVDAGKSTKELLDDSAPALRQEESLAANTKQMELAKDKEIAAAPPTEKAQPSGARQSEPLGQQGSADAAPGGANNLAPVAASQPPAAVLRYGLDHALPPTPAAPPASSSAQPIMADSISQVTTALGTALPPALPNETQKKVAFLSLNGSTDFVQYGYFAATQTPSRIGRSFQLSRETETTARSKAAGPSGLQAPLGNQILVSFRVEQSGSLLRVVDQDGSVYAGPIQAGNAAFAPTAAQSSGSLGAVRNAKLAVAAGLPAVSNLSQQPTASVFQVAGTNRTSNQRVTFSGTLTMGGNSVGGVAAKGATARDRPAAAVQTTNMPLQDVRVFGKAVIGAGQTIDIQAVPVPGQATGNP